MAGIAAVYNRESNSVWLNYLLEEIVANGRGDISCLGAGQAFDDDLVHAPEADGSTQTDLQRNKSARSARRESARRLLSANEVPQRALSATSTRSNRSPLPSPRVPRSPSSAYPPETLPPPPPATALSSVPGVHITSEDGVPGDDVPSDNDPATGLERPTSYRIPTMRFSNYPGSVRTARERMQRQKLSMSSVYSNTIVASEADEDEKVCRCNSKDSIESDKEFPTHPGVRPLAVRRWTMEPSILDHPETEYPKPLALALIVLGVCLSVFIISLDRSIITTATPQITNQFHSVDDIGWYGSGYLLTAASFQPLYGRIFMGFNTKTTFLVSLAIFEIGSLICGVSPSSPVLIVGRAVQGLGSAGVLTGSFVIITHSVPLDKRPIYFAAIGILFGIGALVGPLLGGIFADTISWRWCFYINLPIGGVTLATVFFFFKHKQRTLASKLPWMKRVLALDLVGNAILLSAFVMLFLALQYTEQRYSWHSTRVAGLLSGFGVTLSIFVIWLWYKGDSALLPPRIILQRTVLSSCLAAFFTYAALLVHTYYLPIWFEAVKGASAIHAGVNMIPYMCANALFSLFAGVVVSKSGLFAPPAIVGYAIGTIGAGLLSTLNVSTNSSHWIGYEILTSAGLGMAIQQGFTAVQTALPIEEVPIGTAAVVACQSLGGAVFVSIGNTILQNHLLAANNANQIPGVNIRVILTAGSTAFRSLVPESALPALLQLYDEALQKVFIAAVPMAGLAFVASLGMEWNSIKAKKAETSENLEEKAQPSDSTQTVREI